MRGSARARTLKRRPDDPREAAATLCRPGTADPMPASPTDDLPTIQLLCVEDNPDDVELLALALERANPRARYELHRVDDATAFAQALQRDFDAILCDFNMPRFSPYAALQILVARRCTTPLVVVTRAIGEEAAVHVLRCGAKDYVTKDKLGTLPQIIDRIMVERRRTAEQERMARELDTAYRRLKKLSARVVAAQERERTVISRELHDQLGQTLTGMVIHLHAAQRARPAGRAPPHRHRDGDGAGRRAAGQDPVVLAAARPSSTCSGWSPPSTAPCSAWPSPRAWPGRSPRAARNRPSSTSGRRSPSGWCRRRWPTPCGTAAPPASWCACASWPRAASACWWWTTASASTRKPSWAASPASTTSACTACSSGSSWSAAGCTCAPAPAPACAARRALSAAAIRSGFPPVFGTCGSARARLSPGTPSAMSAPRPRHRPACRLGSVLPIRDGT
jgi:CheY-like chemotaxis protein